MEGYQESVDQDYNDSRYWILDSGCSYLVKRRRGGDG